MGEEMSDLQQMNGFASLLCALILSSLVLNPRVKDGVVIKAGLIAMIGSFIVTAMLTYENSRNWDAYALANLMNRVGLMVACGGVLLKLRKFVRRPKKKSDAHSERTNQQLSGIVGPASDLANLFYEQKPTKDVSDSRKTEA